MPKGPRQDSYSQALARLTEIFRRTRDKHEAHRAAAPVLHEIADDPAYLTSVLERYLRRPGVWNSTHYPVLGGGFELNPYHSLDINFWVPLADGDPGLSTKAIHHHGRMILSTVNIFGPGYEHWTFKPPQLTNPEKDIFHLELLEHGQHSHGHIAFVDANIPHVPFFAPKLSVTVALWSNSTPTTWRDHAKRMPLVKDHGPKLRKVAQRVGLTKTLDLKVLEYFDFYPTPQGFKGMRDRKEFARGPNENFVSALFYIIQQSGRKELAPLIQQALDSGEKLENRELITRLLGNLKADRPITARYSPGHTDIAFANFRAPDIERALAAQSAERLQKAADGR
jgi:hypothetical protein